MQQEHYQELETSLTDLLMGKMPKESKPEIQASVAEAFKQMTDEEKIMTLSEDEVRLLIDFRNWSKSSGSASGVFHWRKQYGGK